MIKKRFLELLKNDIQENDLFSGLLIKALENQEKENENQEKQYFFIIQTLENYYNDYINYIGLLYDIMQLLKKRFNNDITKDNILKCIDILIIRE